jgi:hypothetical protein
MAAFPERHAILSRATSLHDLWFTLLQDLQHSYSDTQASSLRDRIWEFAAWCFDSTRHAEVRNAVAVSFYEHIPHHRPARAELPHRLTREAFIELLPAFRTTLTAPELEEFVTEFLTAKGDPRASFRQVLAAAS